jgi:hypothetical protein
MSEARFQENAEHCDRLGGIMLSSAQRDVYVEMARMWRKLANEAGAHRMRVAAWERKIGVKPSMAISSLPSFDRPALDRDGRPILAAG